MFDPSLFGDIQAYQAFAAGETIFDKGDLGEVMYVVIDGAVEIVLEGRRISYLTTGDIFGEMALVDDRPRSARAAAATDCRLLPLDLSRFMALVQQSPHFAIEVMTLMSDRLRRFMAEELQRQRLEEELAIGHEIQLSLLPERCPVIPGWDIAATYHPARQVGGDLYDFVLLPEDPDHLSIVIADVTGKGVPAAMFMAFSRTIIRAESMDGRSPAETLTRANRFIIRDSRTRLFLSAFYATLDLQSGRMVYANGGHDRPFWRQAATGQTAALPVSGLLLGVFSELSLQEQSLVVGPSDILVFYTDGVTEARDGDGRFYGEARLQALIRNGPPDAAQLLAEIEADVAAFTGEEPQADDYTVVVVRRRQATES